MIQICISDGGTERVFYGKQVIGREFQNRIFVLICTYGVTKGFVSALTYYVIEYASMTPWGIGETKSIAIDQARKLIRKCRDSGTFLETLKAGCKKEIIRRAVRKSRLSEVQSYLDERKNPLVSLRGKKRSVWAKSNGKCHYCLKTLKESSGWHVEHMQPKSLGGSDDLENLVAACASCNLEKSSMTAQDYIQYRKIKYPVASNG